MVLQCIFILQFCDPQLSSSQNLIAVAGVCHTFGLVATKGKGRGVARTRDSGAGQTPPPAGFWTEVSPAPEYAEVYLSQVLANPTTKEPNDAEVMALLADIGLLSDWIEFYGRACDHHPGRSRQVEEVIQLAAPYILGSPEEWMQAIEKFKPFATAETLWIMLNTEHVSDKVLYQFIEAQMQEGFPREASVHVKTLMAISILREVEKQINKLAVSRLAKHFVRPQRRRSSGGPLPSTLTTVAAAIAASSSASTMLGQSLPPPK